MRNLERDKELYLTNWQYFQILKKRREKLDKVAKIEGEDSTETGNKYTESNVCPCGGDVITRDIALFPKDFDKIGKVKHEYPQQFDIKYRSSNQRCPMDSRKNPGLNGCFYTCLFFKHNMTDVSVAKKLYDEEIEKWVRRFEENSELKEKVRP